MSLPSILPGILGGISKVAGDYFDFKKNRDNNIASVAKVATVATATVVTLTKVFGDKKETSMKVGHGNNYLEMHGRR